MADITAINKSGSSKTVLKVLRWIFVSLVFLVLVLALFFQVSWKFDVLLFIVLLTLTVVPKVFRKWIWIAGGGVVVVLIVWVFLPDNDEDWRPYTLDQEIAAFNAKYAVPDELNATVIYEKMPEFDHKEQFKLYDFDPNGVTTTKSWRRREYPKAAQWLDGYNDSLAILLQACRKKACSFQNSFELLLPMDRFSNMKDWTRMLSASGNLDLGEGRIDEGIEKHVAVLRMANHMYQQPSTIEILIALALEAMAQGSIKHFVMDYEATEEQLDLLDEALQMNRYNWETHFPRNLDYDKLFTKCMLLGLSYEINSKGKTRLSRNPNDYIQLQIEADVSRSYLMRKGEKALTILNWFFFPATPDKAGEIVDDSYERFYAMAEPEFDWELEPQELSLHKMKLNFRTMNFVLNLIREDSYYGFHDIYYQYAAQQQASRLIIALVRYKNTNGNWPETLDDPGMTAAKELIRDPINDETFVYRRSGGDFILYSKGKNNIDESGKCERCFSRNATGPDDILIWPAWLEEEEKDE